MTTLDTKDLVELWKSVAQAGGINGYVEQQLVKQNLIVERVSTDRMSRNEKQAYKNSIKAEVAERSRLKRLCWQAYKQTHIVYLGDAIHWNDDGEPDRFDAEEPEIRIANNELPILDGPSDLAQALNLSIGQLRWLTYHRDAAKKLHYDRFEIPKRDGTKRAIWAPKPLLKYAQRWVLRSIVERLPIHGSAHGFVAGRSIATNAKVHTRSKIVLEIDLKDFFPTVSFSRVRGVFRQAGYRKQVATLLALICTESPRKVVKHRGETWFVSLGPRCLPQGAPTSPAITNVLCKRLDRRLKGLADSLGWRYTRYADDLTFSLPEQHKGSPELSKLLGTVHRIVEDEGFMVNKKKTHVARKGARQRVTGLTVNGSQAPRTPRVLRRMLRVALFRLEQGGPLHEGETLTQLEGYAAFVYMTDEALGRQYLDRLQALQTPGPGDPVTT